MACKGDERKSKISDSERKGPIVGKNKSASVFCQAYLQAEYFENNICVLYWNFICLQGMLVFHVHKKQLRKEMEKR